MRAPRDEISSANKPPVLNSQAEQVTTFEALQSSWIQRLKPAAAASTFQERTTVAQAAPVQDERPTVEKFVLGTRTPAQSLVPANKTRAKSSNVKLGKPPLPPTSRSGHAKGKVVQWKVHTVEAKSDQQQQQRNASFRPRGDLFAEFPARLEIKEAETCNQQQQFQSLTPVISPTGTLLIPLKEDGGLEGLGFTKGSNTASLSPQALERYKVENCSNNSSDDRFKPQLRSDSSHCSNFPSPDATASESFSRRACVDSTEVIKVEKAARVPVFQLSRRHDNQAVSRNNDNLERQKNLKRTYFEEFQGDKYWKRSRLPPTEASSLRDEVIASTNASTNNTNTVPLSGIWLQRWNRRSTTPAIKTGTRLGATKAFVDHARKTGPRPGNLKTFVDHSRKTVDAPNAAALAIVGTASRQLQQQRSYRFKVS